jgi:SNF2 family DNA or RNA helicase
MRIPYVIDNRDHKLADVLNELLRRFESRSMDIASAYFNIRGYQLVQDGLRNIGSLRLLLGAKVRSGEDVGLRPGEYELPRLIGEELGREPFDEQALRLVEDLIAFLRHENVQVRAYDKGFLHAKCYILYGDKPGERFLWDRFQPLVGIVGSSNFTGPGLTSNREMNLTHRVLLDEEEGNDPDAGDMVSFLADDKSSPRITDKNRQLLKSEVGARAILDLVNWYDREWEESADFKAQLIEILNSSKFGQKEYTPFEVYIKALYEYLGEDLAEAGGEPAKRSAVELTEFQEDAVKKARKILARYDGVMVADSVGLGKTWIAKKLLEDYAYHMRMKALVVCPASLRSMWERELTEATIPHQIVSQEELGRQEFPVEGYGEVDIIVVEECHNFRNRVSQRYQNLERIIALNGGKGRAGERKRMILVTATPINNDLLDLYSQISLITQGDQGYFAGAGIGDLKRYFLRARHDSRVGRGGDALFNLLDEVVVRRTRRFIREAYPEATIRGERIRFPERRLATVEYDLEGTYRGIYDEVVSGIEGLHLAPYNLESYKKKGVEVDEFERGREQALVGIFKSRYLKRFESSVAAFRISARRALEFTKTFDEYLAGGKLLNSSDFRTALRYVETEDEEDDAVPASRAEEIDETAELQEFLAALPQVSLDLYDLRKLRRDLQADIEALTEIWHLVKPITPAADAKLRRLKELLTTDLGGKKVLVFSYFKDTARYVYRELTGDAEWLASAGNPTLHCMDSGTDTRDRDRVIQRFAPVANGKPQMAGSPNEIDILISTDVLSEGQNLQDCGYVLNYDLHWNPTRMVQRAGRCDRIGSKHEMLYIHNMFPDAGLERLLGLVESLNRKVADIDRQGLLDEPVLAGQTVHPRNFNTLRRIREEDSAVIEEQEEFSELASNELLLRTLKNFLDAQGREAVEGLPDGIHSGLHRPGEKGMFFYFKSEAKDGSPQHFWRYYDFATGEIIDNRWAIAGLIACERDTPRVVADYDVFAIQEKVIEHILESQRAQVALENAPGKPDPLQTTVVTVLRDQMNRPDLNRQDVVAAIKFLATPMTGVQVRELREAHKTYQETANVSGLLAAALGLRETYGADGKQRAAKVAEPITREHLRLVCFDYICS